MLPLLNIPSYPFTVIHEQGKSSIFDPVRKKYVRLTPEEWVRQHIVMFLSEHLLYPISHMVIEKGLKMNGLAKRADILIYDKHLQPSMLVECKAPEIKLTNKVFEQVARYNMNFKVPWLLISNGITYYVAFINHEQQIIQTVANIPHYEELLTR